MIKAILVPTSGSDTDQSVFDAAYTIAKPLAAHLDFYHLCFTRAAAEPHGATAVVGGQDVVYDIDSSQLFLTEAARYHYEAFRHQYGVEEQLEPRLMHEVTCSYVEEINQPGYRLLHRSRRCDLVILGRPRHEDHLPRTFIEDILFGGLRPVVIASAKAPAAIDTVLIGWNESASAERACTAALPLLGQAKRVIIANVNDLTTSTERLDSLARHLRWHGVKVVTRKIQDRSTRALTHLNALAADLGADLIVAGAFGHGVWHSQARNGISRGLIERADIPVFMMH